MRIVEPHFREKIQVQRQPMLSSHRTFLSLTDQNPFPYLFDNRVRAIREALKNLKTYRHDVLVVLPDFLSRKGLPPHFLLQAPPAPFANSCRPRDSFCFGSKAHSNTESNPFLCLFEAPSPAHPYCTKYGRILFPFHLD